MRLELITIGGELLLGFTIDTNAAHLARTLAEIGIEVVRRTTVGDEPESIASAVSDALDRTGAAITTGGLGPTSDDLTKPAIAALFGRGMRRDEAILGALRERWRARGLPGELPRSNEQQALIPDRARILVNRHGSAPGIWLEDDAGRWVAMLPGVPREMRGMLDDELLPMLRERAGRGVVVRSRTLRTAGVAESALADHLGDLAGGLPALPLAYLPAPEGVDLRLTVRAMAGEEADRVLADAVSRIRDRVGRFVYGEDDDDLAAIVLDLARRRNLHIAVAESCTGGLLGTRLTAVPGASDAFWGGVIAYDDSAKKRLLAVPSALLDSHGAVSAPVALAMASGARQALGTEVAVSVTGIAGPTGGTAEKPVGTVYIAVDVDGRAEAWHRHYLGDRDEIRRRSAQVALDFLRRALEVPAAP
ncbi:MAG TPA: competence/damage-inducible protein A [Gemmatimonadaceae bacterium]|nr:competence/damage-inducible protein A [Gemmatimonadaceae bacterium]